MPYTLESAPIMGRSITDAAAIARSVKTVRNPALDFTKGTLVLFMVLYHWINYFIGPQWAYYRYLRFLTPSFIFITGFMISNIYLSRYHADDPRLLKRLLIRGVKLIALFISLNLVRSALLNILSPGGASRNLPSPSDLFTIFISGDFIGKVVAFYILLPIAYLLILSGLLMVPMKSYKYTFHAVCVSLFIGTIALSICGKESQIVKIVAIGMLGIVAGFTPIDVVNKLGRHPYLLAFLYLFYTLTIVAVNVSYPLEVVGTCLSVAIIYLVGTFASKPGRISDAIILLGKYSLFAYIAQIAILQILQVGLRHLGLSSVTLALSFVAAFALSVMAIEVVDRTRVSVEILDKMYRSVFN